MFLFSLSLIILSWQLIHSHIATWKVDESNELPNIQNSKITKKDGEERKVVDIIREKFECDYAHKIVRDIHSEKEMVWDEELAYQAEKWAIHLATEVGKIVHSSFTFPNGSRYGENLYQLDHGAPAGCNLAVHAWYSEIHEYDYDHPGKTTSQGHFTQLIWNETTHFGVGIAFEPKSTRSFIVARYVPAGNWDVDDYKSDVWRPKPGSHIPSIKELVPVGARDPVMVEVGYFKEDNDNKRLPCIDTTDCSYYAQQGDCTHPTYKKAMRQMCYKSCSGCTPGDPIDGGWTNWHEVDICTATCDGGLVMSYRFCTKPFPKYGGKPCEGQRVKKTDCNTQPCPETNVVKTTAVTSEASTTKSPNKSSLRTTSRPFVYSTTKSGETITKQTCKDKNKWCPEYEQLGYCTGSKYSQWMFLNCKYSCDVCDSKRFIPY